jgi:hypothetical protein
MVKWPACEGDHSHPPSAEVNMRGDILPVYNISLRNRTDGQQAPCGRVFYKTLKELNWSGNTTPLNAIYRAYKIPANSEFQQPSSLDRNLIMINMNKNIFHNV